MIFVGRTPNGCMRITVPGSYMTSQMLWRPTAGGYDLGMAAGTEISRFELAYTTIRQRILNGAYGPGYRLVLDELAREIGMSPVPVREAVRRLEAEGYVDFQRNVGARVATFDES